MSWTRTIKCYFHTTIFLKCDFLPKVCWIKSFSINSLRMIHIKISNLSQTSADHKQPNCLRKRKDKNSICIREMFFNNEHWCSIFLLCHSRVTRRRMERLNLDITRWLHCIPNVNISIFLLNFLVLVYIHCSFQKRHVTICVQNDRIYFFCNCNGYDMSKEKA